MLVVASEHFFYPVRLGDGILESSLPYDMYPIHLYLLLLPRPLFNFSIEPDHYHIPASLHTKLPLLDGIVANFE